MPGFDPEGMTPPGRYVSRNFPCPLNSRRCDTDQRKFVSGHSQFASLAITHRTFVGPVCTACAPRALKWAVKMPKILLAALLTICFVPLASAGGKYNRSAGKSAPKAQVQQEYTESGTGLRKRRIVEVDPERDSYGNAGGTQFDLAVDGAFEGETIVVLQLYAFDFETAKQALKQKGFSVYRFNGQAPSAVELDAALEKANQLWIISGSGQQLNAEHLVAIQKFFDAGHGVYIWGDNQPYYADANYVANALLGVTMHGDLQGNQTVKVVRRDQSFGASEGGSVRRDHLLTTGLENIYEGITIATIADNEVLTPIIYGSAGNLVTAVYEKDEKRAILDGGFTRLYNKWDTAGTARYVKNAAAWLSNEERFAAPTLWYPLTLLSTPFWSGVWASVQRIIVASQALPASSQG